MVLRGMACDCLIIRAVSLYAVASHADVATSMISVSWRRWHKYVEKRYVQEDGPQEGEGVPPVAHQARKFAP